MLGPWRRQPLATPLRQRIASSIREGVGLSKHEWLLPSPVQPHELAALGEAAVEWSRVRAGESRRPYGIDQCALALACAHPGAAPLASTTFGVFHPIELYTEDGIPDQIIEFLEALPLQALNESGQPVRFAAALFSWGEVARVTLFADDD